MLYYLNVSIHLLAAFFWLGGMFFLAAVGAPVLRKVEPPSLRAQLFKQLGERFRMLGWVAIGVLLVTGVINLYFRGLLSADLWSRSDFWSTSLGSALAWKLGAVTVMVGISGFHDFISGPAASRMQADSPEAARAKRNAALLARANAMIGVVLVIAAVRLARGG